MGDLVAFSHLALVLGVDNSDAGIKCPIKEFVESDCTNLVGLVTRMKDRAWGDHWDEAIGKKRETRTRKRRKKLKKKASKLKSSPRMSLQDTTFFLLLQQPTQSTTNKIENKNGVLHTQSTRHRLFIKRRLATTTLSEKSRTSLHKIIPRRSS